MVIYNFLAIYGISQLHCSPEIPQLATVICILAITTICPHLCVRQVGI